MRRAERNMQIMFGKVVAVGTVGAVGLTAMWLAMAPSAQPVNLPSYPIEDLSPELTAQVRGLFGQTPATAEAPVRPTGCHGHHTEDGWSLNINRWSNRELVDVANLDKRLSQIDPSRNSNPADVASAIDQLACAGISHDEAVDTIIGVTKTSAALRAAQ